MEKKLSDYLHLYLGCEVLVKDKIITGTGDTGVVENIHIATLTTVSILGSVKQKFRILIGAMSVERSFNFEDDKLVLRPLSDMTEDETNFQWNTFCNIKLINQQVVAEEIRWLLCQHFDLFGLIESGLAIDSTTLKPPQP